MDRCVAIFVLVVQEGSVLEKEGGELGVVKEDGVVEGGEVVLS